MAARSWQSVINSSILFEGVNIFCTGAVERKKMEDLEDAHDSADEEGEVIASPRPSGAGGRPTGSMARNNTSPEHHPRGGRHSSPPPPAGGARIAFVRRPAGADPELRLRRDLSEALADVDAFCRENRKHGSSLSELCSSSRDLAVAMAEHAATGAKLASAARALQLQTTVEAEARVSLDVRLEELRVELKWLGACGACGRRVVPGDALVTLPCGHTAHPGCAGSRGRCGAC